MATAVDIQFGISDMATVLLVIALLVSVISDIKMCLYLVQAGEKISWSNSLGVLMYYSTRTKEKEGVVGVWFKIFIASFATSFLLMAMKIVYLSIS